MKPAHRLILLISVFAALLAGCTNGKGDAERGLSVFVSIPPQAFLVKRIGGPHVKVGVLVRPGQEPHTFEPMPRQMVALSTARIYFTIGIPFEKQLLARLGDGTGLMIVDMAAGIRRRPMDRFSESGPLERTAAGDQSAEGLDPHVWLSPPLIKKLATNTANALATVDPTRAKVYRGNLSTFLVDLDAVDRRIEKMLAPFKGKAFFVYHPSFGYFADRYGLRQEAIEVEGKDPTPRQLAYLIADARAGGVKTVFVQPEFDKHPVEAVARALGGNVVTMDPLARNLLENLEDIARKIDAALAGSAGGKKGKEGR